MKGYAKEEIMHLVMLPQDQADFKPWLLEFYGTVKHSVPAVYTGYIGWFDGDPIALDSTPRSIYSARLVALMGGEEKLLAHASDIFHKANNILNSPQQAVLEWQFAAELATLIIRANPAYNQLFNPEQTPSKEPLKGPKEVADITQKHKGCKHHPALLHKTEGDDIWWRARFLKAACFRQLSYRTICANWRGTYLTAAHELEGVDLLGLITSDLKKGSLITRGVDIGTSITELAVRLKAEDAEATADHPAAPTTKIGLRVTDPAAGAPTGYILSIRNCVLISSTVTDAGTGQIANTDLTIIGTTHTIYVLLGGDNEGGFDGILSGSKIIYPITYAPSSEVSLNSATTFFSYFEVGRFSKSPNIYVH